MKSEGFKELEGFSKKTRIKRDLEFEEVIKKGEKKVGKNLVIFRLKKQDSTLKFGIRVGKSVKKAVKRNRIKRILREILRKNKDKFSPQDRVVVLFRSSEADVDMEELLKEFYDLIR